MSPALDRWAIPTPCMTAIVSKIFDQVYIKVGNYLLVCGFHWMTDSYSACMHNRVILFPAVCREWDHACFVCFHCTEVWVKSTCCLSHSYLVNRLSCVSWGKRQQNWGHRNSRLMPRWDNWRPPPWSKAFNLLVIQRCTAHHSTS